MMVDQKMKAIAKWMATITLVISISACANPSAGEREILIGLTVEAAPSIQQPKNPNPANTGIPSLDELNQKWRVQRMIPVFPEASLDDPIAVRYGLAGVYKLVVPAGTNLNAMIQEYSADPNVAYAELNQPVETK